MECSLILHMPDCFAGNGHILYPSDQSEQNPVFMLIFAGSYTTTESYLIVLMVINVRGVGVALPRNDQKSKSTVNIFFCKAGV